MDYCSWQLLLFELKCMFKHTHTYLQYVGKIPTDFILDSFVLSIDLYQILIFQWDPNGIQVEDTREYRDDATQCLNNNK